MSGSTVHTLYARAHHQTDTNRNRFKNKKMHKKVLQWKRWRLCIAEHMQSSSVWTYYWHWRHSRNAVPSVKSILTLFYVHSSSQPTSIEGSALDVSVNKVLCFQYLIRTGRGMSALDCMNLKFHETVDSQTWDFVNIYTSISPRFLWQKIAHCAKW